MLFNSVQFLIFLPLVICFYFALPYRFRWILLLLSSYYFYMCWKPEYIILILGSSIVDYFASLKIASTNNQSTKKAFLLFSILVNLGVLFFFKYFNFFNQSINDAFNTFNVFYEIPIYEILLPVGISFYTFQTMSYTIDVYRGVTSVEKNFGRFALFVTFWPQLVAGPIERSNNLISQLRVNHDFNYERAASGLRLIAWGFFKKIVIADRLSIYVNEVFNHPGQYEGWPVILAAIFFAYQIYCDFSGYSDIAIGSARIMGYNLMENFRNPYHSLSVKEFWQRWHISLSTWFRDYLYIPLGGNKVVKWRWYYNLFLTFLISGLWHGANWTFVAWGALHGIFLVFSYVIKSKSEGLNDKITLRKFFKWLLTFILVVIAWVFFRANTIQDAFVILKSMLMIFRNNTIFISFTSDHLIIYETLISIGLIILLESIQIAGRYSRIEDLLVKKAFYLRWITYLVIVEVILWFGYYGSNAEFIYFQF